ncbi:hypothetical protein H920_13612 [Fukomys damarensis]|uniref:Uncharacterized protein n=1 Tax=Fukomys damarensis TaxID=885580 RepID=A0A091D428_FUKDA|nr:hypothetical protein H920_13612 [Fukomys damarensis]
MWLTLGEVALLFYYESPNPSERRGRTSRPLNTAIALTLVTDADVGTLRGQDCQPEAAVALWILSTSEADHMTLGIRWAQAGVLPDTPAPSTDSRDRGLPSSSATVPRLGGPVLN